MIKDKIEDNGIRLVNIQLTRAPGWLDKMLHWAGVHYMTQWSEPRWIAVTTLTFAKERALIQDRHCLICGLYQSRDVTRVGSQ